MRSVAALTCVLTLVGTAGRAEGGVVTRHFAIMILPGKMDMTRHIGTRKAGLLCLPAGALTWRDADPGTPAVEAAASRGWNLATSDNEFTPSTSPTHKVSGTIVAAELDACMAEKGLLQSFGGRKSTEVRGSITIQWRVFDTRLKTVVFDERLMQMVNAKDRTLTVVSAVAAAVEASAATTAARFDKDAGSLPDGGR